MIENLLEQIIEYIRTREPSLISKCPISGRWEVRLWNVQEGEVLNILSPTIEGEILESVILTQGIITETSEYSEPPESADAYISFTGKICEFKKSN